VLYGNNKSTKAISAMTESILDGKRVLAIDDEPDVLAVLEEEIAYKCPNAVFEKATTYEDAKKLLESSSYDIVVLDIMGVRGFDLLEIAVKRNFKVAMLTAHALSPEALKRSYTMKARAFLPKNKLGEIVPFLEDVLKYDYQSGWKRLFKKLHSFFTEEFESDWEKKTGLNWREWGK
jgi:DNA-binding NtrC family response regulator